MNHTIDHSSTNSSTNSDNEINMILYQLPQKADFDKPAYNTTNKKWYVKEQLYPENRGYQSHKFDSLKDAVAFFMQQ
jgi:hypothetical protein